MFKFINFVKESIKEGVEEGRQELKAEEELISKQTSITLDQIEVLPVEEIFGTSLATPFRTTVFMDWFALFKSDKMKKEENVIPIHLYTFGELGDFDKDTVERLNQQQKESFPVENAQDVLAIVKSFLEGLNIPMTSLDGVDKKYDSHELISFHEGELLPAWSLSAAASTLVSGVEFNGVSKEEALKIFLELLPIVKNRYKDWSEFGQEFASNDIIITNNKREAKRTYQTIHNLNFKFGSPWIQYPLENYITG